jgi:hypothetical protein
LANPQSRVFSPFVLLDILFHPQNANLASLMIYAFAGLWGMYLLLRALNVENKLSVLGAVLFVNSSWFGLHYAEGHIPFGAMQVLPWVLYLAMKLPSASAIVALHALFAWMLVDGQIYPAIFSGLLIVSAFCFRLIPMPAWRHCLTLWRWWLGSFVAFLCVSAPKTMPVLSQHLQRVPMLEVDTLGWKAALNMFFYPRHVIWASLHEPSHWGFHEYGCYIGLVSFGLVAFKLTKQNFRRAQFSALLMIGFWLWTAMGWFYPFNPWYLFQQLPLLKNAHVNSRVLILAFLPFIILLMKSMQNFKSPKLVIWIGAFLLLESIVLRNQAFYRQSTRAWEGESVITQLIDSDKIDRTIDFAFKPGHYLNRNTGSRSTYEPAAPKTAVKVVGESDYQGEIGLSAGAGKAEVLEYTPGLIRVDYDSTEPSQIVLNTNTLDHWFAEGVGNPAVTSQRGENLQFTAESGKGEIVLRYSPMYLGWIVPLYIIGWLLFILMLVSRWRIRDSD